MGRSQQDPQSPRQLRPPQDIVPVTGRPWSLGWSLFSHGDRPDLSSFVDPLGDGGGTFGISEQIFQTDSSSQWVYMSLSVFLGCMCVWGWGFSFKTLPGSL